MTANEEAANVSKLKIEITPGDAEMVAAWAEEGLKGRDNAVGRDAVRRFRDAFNAAARTNLGIVSDHSDAFGGLMPSDEKP